MRFLCTCFALMLAAFSPARAQFFYPSSTSTRLHFPQLADGGPPAQKWTTTILLANPDPLYSATVTITFYADNGDLLPLDFGQGMSSRLVVTIPVGGTQVLTSTGGSSSTAFVTGWGRAVSTLPIYGTVIYRATTDGRPVWDVAAAGAGATYFYSSLAAYTTGVALANPSGTDTIHLRLTPRDQNGTRGAAYIQTLRPLEHTSFVLGPGKGLVSTTFKGVIDIVSTDTPPQPFLAWALYERDGLLSPLPPGEMRFPTPQSRRPGDVLALLQAWAPSGVLSVQQWLSTPPATIIQYVRSKTVVLDESNTVKANYQSSDDTIHITRAMVDMLGTSDAALAFVLTHMVARGVMDRVGLPNIGIAVGLDIQTASDVYALGGLLIAGFDPNGITDFYGRLYIASALGVPIDPSVISEFGPLSQMGTRQARVWERILQGCAAPQLSSVCQQAHDYWHPRYPANIP